MRATANMTFESIAQQLAESQIPAVEILDAAQGLAKDKRPDFAWICREAIAIRIVDLPNQTHTTPQEATT